MCIVSYECSDVFVGDCAVRLTRIVWACKVAVWIDFVCRTIVENVSAYEVCPLTSAGKKVDSPTTVPIAPITAAKITKEPPSVSGEATTPIMVQTTPTTKPIVPKAPSE